MGNTEAGPIFRGRGDILMYLYGLSVFSQIDIFLIEKCIFFHVEYENRLADKCVLKIDYKNP